MASKGLDGHQFNSTLFIECGVWMLAGDEYRPWDRWESMIADGYKEIVCEKRAEWEDGVGYSSLRGYILERMYRTESAMLYQSMGNRITGRAVSIEEGCGIMSGGVPTPSPTPDGRPPLPFPIE